MKELGLGLAAVVLIGTLILDGGQSQRKDK